MSKLPFWVFSFVVFAFMVFKLVLSDTTDYAVHYEIVPDEEVAMAAPAEGSVFEARDYPAAPMSSPPMPPPAADAVRPSTGLPEAVQPSVEEFFPAEDVTLQGRPVPMEDYAGSTPPVTSSFLEKLLNEPDKFKLLLAGILTLVCAPLALFAVFTKGISAESRKWAYTTLGTLLGYWLS